MLRCEPPIHFGTSPCSYMADQMKTVPAKLIQMIRGKVFARLPRTTLAEFSMETPLEDLRLDSLDKLSLLFEIEDLFNVAIPEPQPPR